jgi:transposase
LHPDKPVEVWSQDEARVGLKPILCKVWALKGQRPLAFHRTRYEWLYVYLFVHPASGRSTFLILPTVNSALMRLALREFQQEVDPEGRKVLLLLLDNAGWHRAKDLQVPPGLLLLHLPPYTPELSPAEPVVPLLREAVANESFPSLEALQERLAERCVYLQEHPEVIRGVAGFGWIPEE